MSDNTGFIPTNSLASVNFDVLKVDAVEDPLIDLNRLATMDFEESYFAMGVKFINECRDEITDSKLTLYASLREATSESVVLEAFSDYYTSVRAIIDKFIKFLRSLVDKFITSLMTLIKSDKYLAKCKNSFNEFKNADTFTFEGFKYTFSPEIPSANAALEFNASLFDNLFGDSRNELTIEAIKDSIAGLNLEGLYSDFRGKVLNLSRSITISEFPDVLFRIYRDGKSSADKIDVDKKYVNDTVDRYFKYADAKKDVEKNRKLIEDAYDKLANQVKEITARNGDLSISAFLNNLPAGCGIQKIDGKAADIEGFTMSAEIMAQIDVYIRAKCDQIQEYSNIHILAFSAKLDAMKEAYRQDRNVLYMVLNKIGVTHETAVVPAILSKIDGDEWNNPDLNPYKDVDDDPDEYIIEGAAESAQYESTSILDEVDQHLGNSYFKGGN